MSDSNLGRGKKERLSEKFESAASDFKIVYESLRDHRRLPCDFPDNWEGDNEADEVDSCRAIDQIVTRASEWGRVFAKNCRREVRGLDPWNKHDRIIAKVSAAADKAKLNLSCNV